MQRDWGLFAIGVGTVVLSASVAVPALLVYGDYSGCDRNPNDDVAAFGGRPCDPDAFDRWISDPGTVAFLAASFVLLLAAIAVMHRGLTRPRQW
jgi:hypothetical protein